MFRNLISIKRSQKIILTIWIVLLSIVFICSLQPMQIVSGYGIEKSWFEPNLSDIGVWSVIVSVPMFIIYKIWGK